MLKKIKNISFVLKSIENPYDAYKKEIEGFWNKIIATRKDIFNGDILSVSDIEDNDGEFRISYNYIKFADVAYSKLVGNVKTRSLFSGGYIITKDGFICYVIDKSNSLSLVGGTASLDDVVDGIYNPDLCMIREFKEEIGLDITDNNFNFSKTFLKYPDEEQDKNFHYPVGVLYEIKTNYTKQELNDLFCNTKHDNELKSIVFLKPNDTSQLDEYAKKDYLDDLYKITKELGRDFNMRDDRTDITIETYDNIVEEYVDYFKSFDLHGNVQFQREIDYICESLKDNARILDAGTAIGDYPKFLTENMPQKNYEVIGIDTSSNMIEYAKKKAPKAQFKVMDIRKLDFNDSYFDAIICFATLIHLDDEDCKIALDEFDRVLNYNGILAINVMEWIDGPKEIFDVEPFNPKYKTYFNRYKKEFFLDYFKSKNYDVLQFLNNPLFNPSKMDGSFANSNEFSIIVKKKKSGTDKSQKIMVCDGVKDLKEYLENHKDKKICLYLAEKTKEAWDISTSRVYMNQIDDRFVYLPVNIKKGDWESIKEVYTIAENNEQIVAINQTQPHKSNPVQREWFANQDIPQNVDSLIKDKNNKLQCYNLNGPSFASWFEDEVTSFSKNKVIVFGVGGVGEPIARIIADKNPESLYLVDIFSKEDLAKELSQKANVTYYDSLSKADFNSDNKVILINCAGKEGGDDETVTAILSQLKDRKNIFVDLRPQLDIAIVNVAKRYGWDAYTGFGMNTRNDYVLLQKIQETTGIDIPSFEEFAKLVKDAS